MRKIPEQKSTAIMINQLPPMNADLLDILGRPNFACAGLAQALRVSGENIPQKSEAEQAAVIYWMLTHYLKHGELWRDAVSADLKAWTAKCAIQNAMRESASNGR